MNTEQNATRGPSDRERRAAVLRALGDANRLAIVELLQVQDLSPDALAAALEIPGNLLAHHLKVLEAAGVITRRHSQNDRRRTYVQMVGETLAGLLPLPDVVGAPRVVFVCTHNSARSVMAEALWRTVSDVPSTSAGTHPADTVNPRAVDAIRRIGLEFHDAAPRSVVNVLRPDDLVVSVCDAVNEELRDMPNAHIHWSVPDPSRTDTDAAFTAALSEIGDRVDHLAPRVRYRRPLSRRSRR